MEMEHKRASPWKFRSEKKMQKDIAILGRGFDS